MSISIFDALATLPSGMRSTRLAPDQLARYLRDNCDREEDRDRERRHALRDEMYRDGGCEHMRSVISDVFEDPKVAERRKKWIDKARFNNPLKRIVNELSTVYQREARRFVAGERDQFTYRELLDAVSFDESMLLASRMLTLHRAILVGFRAVVRADGTKDPVLEILTPSVFRPVLDPNDGRHVLGWLVKCHVRLAGDAAITLPASAVPHWVLWTTHEVMQLTGDFEVIDGSYTVHGLTDEDGKAVSPYVAVTAGPPQAGFWCGHEGEDLVAARVSVWVANIFMLKETKSATKMPIMAGDVSRAARNQSIDTEDLIEVPDGASFTTVDTSMDLSTYRDVANHVTDSTGANYGLTPTLMNNEGVQSADARDLMRIPLNELRDQQKIAWRKAERRICVVMSAVTRKELPEYAFSAAGFRADFAEGATPLGEKDEFALFQAKMSAGIDCRSDYLIRKNPDLTYEGAIAHIERCIDDNTSAQALMRPMNAISGADLGGDPALVAQRQAEMARAEAAANAEAQLLDSGAENDPNDVKS